ncbi:rod shape-determining protein MreD [Clostridium sp. cel8]|jgi:rod shape-determining protein MreD|uniref:rod shape-determining protein MreD n=1 Tax=unclassified Clostridium TaxID=2614128 RepID=UPI0015F4F7B8|nr:rod shape-determining protein MreD [Clostridium sp. cel8]MBA5849928.1 rod shape-determining protein MreD [Clostridium sp. cel8]
MKKIFILLFLLVILFILDNSVVPFLAIKTVYPSLLFVFIICYCIASESYYGLFIGIFAGILQDIYFIDGFWINAFVNMIVCVISGFIGNSIFKDKKFIPVLSCFGLSILKGLFLFVILWLSGITINLVSLFFVSIYNTVVGFFMYKPVYRLSQISYMKTEWKF